MIFGRDVAERYLLRLRGGDEARALRKARATEADLRAWRRDSTFREAERAAIAAPRAKPRVINLANLDAIDSELALLRRRRDAGHAAPEDLARLSELERGGA